MSIKNKNKIFFNAIVPPVPLIIEQKITCSVTLLPLVTIVTLFMSLKEAKLGLETSAPLPSGRSCTTCSGMSN